MMRRAVRQGLTFLSPPFTINRGNSQWGAISYQLLDSLRCHSTTATSSSLHLASTTASPSSPEEETTSKGIPSVPESDLAQLLTESASSYVIDSTGFDALSGTAEANTDSPPTTKKKRKSKSNRKGAAEKKAASGVTSDLESETKPKKSPKEVTEATETSDPPQESVSSTEERRKKKKKEEKEEVGEEVMGEGDTDEASFIPADVLKRFYPTVEENQERQKADLLSVTGERVIPMPSLPPHSVPTKETKEGTTLLFSQYQKEFEKSFINPFSGKLTSIRSPVGKALSELGFYRNKQNPLRLEWSPVHYFKGFQRALERVKKKKKYDSAEAVPSDEVLDFMVKKLGKSALLWQEHLASLLRREDVFSVMASELSALYDGYTQVYMPPRLDAAPDPALVDTVLTPDQQNVLTLAERGYNLYVGGSAGTGKTVLLKSIYRSLSQRGLRVAVTATTGVAAVQLGGCTFHYAFNAPVVLHMKRWDATALRAVDVVIIDEVSLLNAARLDAFDMEARLARMNKAPFGGIQVILCGDFLQLSIEGVDETESQPLYESQAFSKLVQVRLVTPMRHAAGDPLLELLTKLRRGQFDAKTFEQLDRPIPEDASHITYIFPRRREAKLLNERKLEELPSAEHHYVPQRGPLELVGSFTPSAFIDLPIGAVSLPSRDYIVQLLREEILRVCPQAVAINEMDCVVMPARTAHLSMLVRVRLPDKALLRREGCILGAAALNEALWKEVAERVAERVGGRLVRLYDKEPPNLVPLSVSMSLADTTHSDAEALTPLRLKLGCRVMVNRNLSRTVSNGSVGVVEAFSAPDPNLFPHGIGTYSFHQIKDRALFTTLPVVRLLSGEVVQIPPITVPTGGTPLTYFYKHDVYPLPLQLGYSFTVHKVQGLTLQGTVVMDCAHFFDCPHLLYVACSRVRSLDQLIVYNVKPKMILVRRSALAFADSLRPAHDPLVLQPPADMPRAAWTERAAPRVLRVSD